MLYRNPILISIWDVGMTHQLRKRDGRHRGAAEHRQQRHSRASGFVPVSLLGQALGPLLVGFGSQNMFSGPTALASSFALFTGLFGMAMIVSAALLRRNIRWFAQTASPPAKA